MMEGLLDFFKGGGVVVLFPFFCYFLLFLFFFSMLALTTEARVQVLKVQRSVLGHFVESSF